MIDKIHDISDEHERAIVQWRTVARIWREGIRAWPAIAAAIQSTDETARQIVQALGLAGKIPPIKGCRVTKAHVDQCRAMMDDGLSVADIRRRGVDGGWIKPHRITVCRMVLHIRGDRYWHEAPAPKPWAPSPANVVPVAAAVAVSTRVADPVKLYRGQRYENITPPKCVCVVSTARPGWPDWRAFRRIVQLSHAELLQGIRI